MVLLRVVLLRVVLLRVVLLRVVLLRVVLLRVVLLGAHARASSCGDPYVRAGPGPSLTPGPVPCHCPREPPETTDFGGPGAVR
ncbi:hypothetical protein GCM10009814_28450 [Lapillicoccus jejuensis]